MHLPDTGKLSMVQSENDYPHDTRGKPTRAKEDGVMEANTRIGNENVIAPDFRVWENPEKS